MRTLDQIRRGREQELTNERACHRERIATIEQHYDELEEKAEAFGGFLDRAELADYLGVSNPRITKIVQAGKIRESSFGYSLADATKYRDTRKTGRPRIPGR